MEGPGQTVRGGDGEEALGAGCRTGLAAGMPVREEREQSRVCPQGVWV